MPRTVGIGIQDFGKMIENNYFYVDKSAFIKEWWEGGDEVTLITRPRRFGKTLTMSMVEQFFSLKYAGRNDLFEGLYIWKQEDFRELQGIYPVISLSFANVKETNYQDARVKICQLIASEYARCAFLLEEDCLTEQEKDTFLRKSIDMGDVDATLALHQLSEYMHRYYHKKVIILLDEYDTPMQEAYVHGYWDELTAFIRSMFNSTFKTNPYLERAIMTGITRVSKGSIFSDLNNLEVVTTTSSKYGTAFGFTEEEVFTAMDEFGLDEKEKVKSWYDGFIFGKWKDIYNPWSILNFLDKRKFTTYWANTSSNSLVGKLIREGSRDVKASFERLLKGEHLWTPIDEQIVYSQLNDNEYAIWSLLVASGYLKVLAYEEYDSEELIFAPKYELALTTFSYFDTGNKPSEFVEPERFYHGFVLGLMVELANRYTITSNRESGFGRYDIMLEPIDKTDDAIIIEFKVHDAEDEKTLQDTVADALRQIEEKQYTAALMAKGISEKKIRQYGFAFEGKKVRIG